MTNSSRTHTFSARIATILTVLFLLFLFIFPHRQITRLKATLLPYAEAATEAVVLEDWPRARTLTQSMLSAYLPYDDPLRLYLDHEDVDELQTRIRSCANLARAEDEQIIVDLEDVKNTLNYLQSIETFNVWNLF